MVAIVSALGGCAPGGQPQVDVEIHHLHGLAFSSDGHQLIVPAHHGILIYADGRWQAPELPTHDYMGYAPVDDGFYSSGHPDPSSDFVNPLGLVRSRDAGRSLTQLGFEGESDFHVMGVGYRSHAVYVWNPAPNSRLDVGMFYTLDDGSTWQQSGLDGLTAEPIQIAVHPVEPNVVALAAEEGLFFSRDHGDSFERLVDGPATAATFSPDGSRLLFGYDRLYAYDLAGQEAQALPTPALSAATPIMYIAVNPVQPDQIAIGTVGRDIYVSDDGGNSWKQIAREGRGES
ncbi:MAG TPA: hypothetical protein VER55_15185 [Ardenticatenaceae bacterium]|nr:hypothetical protein [Ardenticatenaceae bacterium]